MLSQHSNTFDDRSWTDGHRRLSVEGRPPPFCCRFGPTPEAVRVVRRALGQWLSAHHRVNVDGIDDLLIVCSELCTNAVRSASDTEGSVAVRAWSENHGVILEVEDDGAGFAWPSGRRLQDVPDEEEHGRGLFIVAGITDEMEVHVEGGRTVVRCVKRHVLDHAAPDHDRELSASYRSEPPPGQPNH